MTITPEHLLTLLRAMGRTGYLDHSGGYGVVRVIERLNQKTSTGLTFAQVWDPVNSGDQAWEVAAWLLRNAECPAIRRKSIEWVSEDGKVLHNGTQTDLRRAVVEAACRVAEGMK